MCPGGNHLLWDDHVVQWTKIFFRARIQKLIFFLLLFLFREEWQWLQALSSLDESLEMDHDVQSAPHQLLQDLRSAIKDLMAHINVPGNQVRARPGSTSAYIRRI